MYKITTDSTEEMVEICSQLVKKSINFEARWEKGKWIIECTGGY